MKGQRSILCRCASGRGVTLLEVLVAMVIAVAGLSVAIGAIAQSQRSSLIVERTSEELALARTVIEEAFLGTLPDDAISESAGSSTTWSGTTASGLAWEAEVRTTVTSGFNVGAINADAGLGQVGSMSAGQMPIELITVRVGSIELRTTRW